MNICQVIISNGWGGAETVVFEMTKHFLKKGESVSIVLNEEMAKYYTDFEDLKMLNIGTFREVSESVNYSLLMLPFNSRLKNLTKKVSIFLQENKVDIIHAHMPKAIFLLSGVKNIETPRIATAHGAHILREITPVRPHLVPWTKWKAMRFKRVLSEMDRITTVSSFMRNALAEWGVAVEDKATVIYNGIDLNDVTENPTEDVQLRGEFNILFPGGYKSRKGGDLLLKAMREVVREIPSIHLYITLDVPQNHVLRKMVDDFGLRRNVTFTGFLSLTEYRGLLRSVDLLVMPSREEAFGIVYAEAMMFGKPVIAGNTGGIPEVIQDGRNGVLIEPEEHAVADAILFLYRNEELRMRISSNSMHDVSKFSWDNIATQYLQLYNSLLLPS